jgi:hypothetical protein
LQRIGADRLPAGVPQARGLAGHAELAGDLDLGNADRE